MNLGDREGARGNRSGGKELFYGEREETGWAGGL